MILRFLEIIIVCCAAITLIGSVIRIHEEVLASRISKMPIDALPVRKTVFCRMVVDWCHENIAHPDTRKPRLSLNYRPNKTKAGLYHSRSHECVIFINCHGNIREVVNTVIHEYVHARQKNRDFDRLYDRHQREIGYEGNPFEVEARMVSSKHEKECMIVVYNRIRQLRAS